MWISCCTAFAEKLTAIASKRTSFVHIFMCGCVASPPIYDNDGDDIFSEVAAAFVEYSSANPKMPTEQETKKKNRTNEHMPSLLLVLHYADDKIQGAANRFRRSLSFACVPLSCHYAKVTLNRGISFLSHLLPPREIHCRCRHCTSMQVLTARCRFSNLLYAPHSLALRRSQEAFFYPMCCGVGWRRWNKHFVWNLARRCHY